MTEKIEDRNVEGIMPLISPRAVKAAQPLTPRAADLVLDTRRAIRDVLHGRDRERHDRRKEARDGRDQERVGRDRRESREGGHERSVRSAQARKEQPRELGAITGSRARRRHAAP